MGSLCAARPPPGGRPEGPAHRRGATNLRRAQDGHLARYTLFYWPLAIVAGWLGAAPALSRLWTGTRAGRARLLVPAAALLVLYSAEVWLRVQSLGPGHSLADVASAPSRRRVTTDALLANLQMPNATKDQPVVVGVVEVQQRYWLDSRVRVASLDGVVDARLRHFVREGYYDQLAFAKVAGITHFLEFPNFNRDPTRFSLRDLARLAPGDTVHREGVLLVKLPGGAVRVEVDGSPGAEGGGLK